jgi:hypothetical protein
LRIGRFAFRHAVIHASANEITFAGTVAKRGSDAVALVGCSGASRHHQR